MTKIYCFGDSHSWFFNFIEGCEAIPMGPKLAYSFGDLVEEIGYILYSLVEKQHPDKYSVLFTFGEIDIRVHLNKHNNISECVDRYVEGILKIKNLGNDVIVFGPIASRRDEDLSDSEYPTSGNCFERNKIAKEFSNKLEILCNKNNIKYISILDSLIDKDGLTIEKYYSEDHVHLNKLAVALVEPLLLQATSEKRNIFKLATFDFNGKSYPYYVNYYNDTRHNERAVEIALAINAIEKYQFGRILEVGDVLPNYVDFKHDIVDKYDKGENTIHEDILYYTPSEKYDLIISVSTFEHVGWDMGEGRGSGKIKLALEHTKTLLKPGGMMMVTLPLGYNDELDEALKKNDLQFDNLYCMGRDNYNNWSQVELSDALSGDYARDRCSVGSTTCPNCSTEIGICMLFTKYLVIGYYYGRPERKEYKATFSTSLDSEAS
jgi:hypothetical protein